MIYCTYGVKPEGMTMEEWRRRSGMEEWNFNITFHFFTKWE